MKRTLPLLLAAMLALSACGDDADQASGEADTPEIVEESDTTDEAGEAMEALGEAARETGEAARSAADDLGEAVGPALERAGEVGENMLDAAGEGLNDVTRSAACQTARAADDAEGVEANC